MKRGIIILLIIILSVSVPAKIDLDNDKIPDKNGPNIKGIKENDILGILRRR